MWKPIIYLAVLIIFERDSEFAEATSYKRDLYAARRNFTTGPHTPQAGGSCGGSDNIIKTKYGCYCGHPKCFLSLRECVINNLKYRNWCNLDCRCSDETVTDYENVYKKSCNRKLNNPANVAAGVISSVLGVVLTETVGDVVENFLNPVIHNITTNGRVGQLLGEVFIILVSDFVSNMVGDTVKEIVSDAIREK